MTTISTSAHGRVNLIGEHTDYNDGFVLPTGIPQATNVILRPRADRRVSVTSSNILETAGPAFSFELGREERQKVWADYVQGATWLLQREFAPSGAQGFEIEIDSTVPLGSGLSSSAALLVAVLRALRTAWRLESKIDDVQIAQLSQKVENDFVGARVGIMDPMAASLASEGSALFIDTRTLAFEKIAIPKDKMEIAVINSGLVHSNAHGGYNQRRNECEKACELLSVSSLRDVGFDRMAEIERLPEPFNRRAKHVITENRRVLAAVEALRTNDCRTLGRLFAESHASMRDDYQISVPQIDTLVEIAAAQPEVFGARLTGGGFGGSIVIAARAGAARVVAERVNELYQNATGGAGVVLVPQRRP